jgi:diguanylate cyclase (GGDEF)-like protein/PAS domain S-box-containing protein
MGWFFNVYSLILFTCGLAAAGVAVFAWRERAQAGPGPALTLWGVTIWSLSYGIAIGVHDLTARIFWAKMLHIGVVLTAISTILLLAYYLGHPEWLTWRNLFVLSAIPLSGLILTWTNEWHALIWSQIQLRIDGSLGLTDVTFGPFFWIYAAYNGLVWLVCVVVFVRAALVSPYLERQQARSMLAGVLMPGLALSIDLARIKAFHGVDVLPLGFSLAAFMIAWGLFRYQLFKIVPVAREIVLDKIIDGVLVLDKDGRIVDANPAMLRMISHPVSRIIGQPVSQILDGQLELVGRYRNVPKAQTQIVLYTGDKLSYYDLFISTLYVRRNQFNGQVLLLHDITERKQAEDAIKQAHEHLDATLNALPDMLFEVDQAGLIYDFRAPNPELLFLPAHEFLGKPLGEILPEEAVQIISYTLAQAKEQGKYRGTVYSLPLPTGLGWFELSVALKGDPKVPDGRFVVLVRDITERKNAEDALRENEKRYRELYDMVQRQAQEKSLLDEVRMAVARELDLPVVIRKVVDGISKTFGYSLVSLYMVDGEMALLQHQVGYEQVIHTIPLTQGVIGKVLRSGQSVLLNDVRHHPDFLEAMPGVKSEVCVPLFDRGGVVGVLNVESVLDEFSEADLRLLSELGEHISIAIGRARLYKEMQESEENYRLLFYQSPVGIIHFDAQLRVTDCNSNIVDIFQTRRELILGFDLNQIEDQSVLPALRQAIAGQEGRYEGFFSASSSSDAVWIWMLTRPLFDKNDWVRGGMAIIEDITDRKMANDRLESQLAEIQLLQAELQERMLRDPLTGLYNRRYLQETLPREFARLERIGHSLGVIIMDVDHFKNINDSYGHDAGDIVLQTIGKLLLSNVRTGDIACRHGGDEFLIVMPDASLQVCQERAERIRLLFEDLVTTYNSRLIRVTVSMGVAAYPLHGSNKEEILTCADRALYKAKQAGRNQVVTCQDKLEMLH